MSSELVIMLMTGASNFSLVFISLRNIEY